LFGLWGGGGQGAGWRRPHEKGQIIHRRSMDYRVPSSVGGVLKIGTGLELLHRKGWAAWVDQGGLNLWKGAGRRQGVGGRRSRLGPSIFGKRWDHLI